MMNNIEARLLADGQYAVHVNGCGHCHGCGPRKSKIILAGVTADRVGLQLSAGAQFQLLWYSLVMPLLMVVLVAIACAMLQVAESTAVCLTLFVFILAMMSCREVPVSDLKILEAGSAP